MYGAESTAQAFTRAEVKELAGKPSGSVPFILHDKGTTVYDVAGYLEDHPGGSAILKGAAGTDATAAFDDVGHSEDARHLLHRFCIGQLTESEVLKAKVRSVFISRKIKVSSDGGRLKQLLRAVMALVFSQSFAQNILTIASALLVAKLLWPGLFAWGHLAAYVDRISAFWRGVTLATIGSGACFSGLGWQFSKTIVMAKGFRMHPPVMRPVKVLKGAGADKTSVAEGAESTIWAPVQLIRRAQTAIDTCHITFRTVERGATGRRQLTVPAGQHIQLRAQIGRLQVTRSYTPVSTQADASGYTTLTLAVRVYPDGKMGRLLSELPLNATTIECRGPVGSFKGYHRFLCDEIGAVAGGSGITPLYGLIKRICEDEKDDTKIRLLYANKSSDKVMLGPELDELARTYPDTFQLHYFFTKMDPTAASTVASKVAGGSGKGAASTASAVGGDTSLRNVHAGAISIGELKALLPAVSAESKYLLCGPDAMVEQMGRDLVKMGARAPQPVGHVTDQVFVF